MQYMHLYAMKLREPPMISTHSVAISAMTAADIGTVINTHSIAISAITVGSIGVVINTQMFVLLYSSIGL